MAGKVTTGPGGGGGRVTDGPNPWNKTGGFQRSPLTYGPGARGGIKKAGGADAAIGKQAGPKKAQKGRT